MRQLHDFQGMALVTYFTPYGYYVAHEHEVDLDLIQGFGKTREAAIEDFADQWSDSHAED